MATPKVLIKRSSVAGRIPTAGDLDYGELAINYQDGKVYYKDASNNIKAFIDSARVEEIANAVEVVANAQLDSSEVTNLIDSAYVQVLVPETYLSTIIDAAYVQARQTAQDFAYSSLTGAPTIPTLGDFVDSDQVIAIVDSAYVQARQVDLQRDSGFITTIIDSDYVQARQVDLQRDSAFTTDIVDSAYVQARQIKYNTSDFADSAYVTSQIPSVPTLGVDFVDSTLAGAMIDSAILEQVTKSFVDALNTNADTLDGFQGVHYLQYSNLQGTPVIPTFGNDFVDSDAVIALVDSAYVRARVRTDQDLRTTDNVTFNQLRGPANFIIDPAAVGDNTGTVQILGNLQVEGTQTTINSTTVSINDKNIVLADSAANAAAADGAGITINGANATLQYAATGDKFVFNKPFEGDYLGFDSDFNAKSTTNLSEGTNLYYTKARADSDIAASLSDSTNSVTVTITNTITDQVDSAYVLARVAEAPFLDSTNAIQLIDSAYVAARTTAGTDSAAIIQLIDSAYVAARTSAGTDSATVISLINSTVHDSDVAINLNNLVELGLGKNVTQNAYTSVNATVTGSRYDDGSTSGYSTAHPYLQVSSLTNFLAGMDSGEAIWVSSDGVNFTNPSSVTWTGQYKTTSGTGQANLVQLSTSVNFWTYNGQTVYSGADVLRRSLRLQGDSSSSKIIASKNLSIEGDNGATITVDGYNIKDSGTVTSIIDSAYVRLQTRIGDSDIDFGSNKILYSNVYSVEGDLPSATDYHGMFAHVHGTGAGYFAHAGNWVKLANYADINPYSDAHVTTLVDSAYVALRDRFQDSAGISAIVDSDYIQLRQSGGAVTVQDEGSALSTSATTLNFVGSGVVASGTGATKTITISGGGGGGGSGGLDSALTTQLIDSDYVASIISSQAGELTTVTTTITATASQVLFPATKPVVNADVFVNGILMVLTTDYTIDSASISLVSAAGAGDIISIVDRDVVHKQVAVQSLRTNKFTYTATLNQTIFTGADNAGVTLSVPNGSTDVFLNGILLVDSDDYSINGAGTTVTLTTGTDASDGIIISNQTGTVVTPHVDQFEYVTSSPATVITGVDQNGKTLSYNPNSVQVHVNGILLKNFSDYTASNGYSIVLTEATIANDDVVVSAFSGIGNADLTTYKFTASAGQTHFSGEDTAGKHLNYENDNIQVFLNGLLLNDSDDYTAIGGKSVTLLDAANLNDELKVSAFARGRPLTGPTNAWKVGTGTVSASAGEKIFIDTSGGVRTVNLPSTASQGDEIRIVDVTGNAGTNNITIGRNGHNIQGAASNLTININRTALGLVYYDATQGWLLTEN